MKAILRAGVAGVAMSFAILSAPVLAQEQETRSYLTGGATYVFEDFERASDDGIGGFLGFGKTLNEQWTIEFSGFYNEFKRDQGGPEWEEYGAKLDGLFFYSRDARFSPYVGFGVGGIQTDVNFLGQDFDSFDPFVDAGVGFISYVGSRFGLRADLRYRYFDPTDIPNTSPIVEPVLRVGAVIALGPKPVVEPKGPADADGDGVADDADLCPSTPKGVKVDAKGCPPVNDEDSDGVPDDQDRCPGTAKGVAVDKNGCPITGSGKFKVTGQGADLRFEDAFFEFDRYDLSDYGKAMLDDAASVIEGLTEKYPSLKIDISGHTDSVGSDGYNQGLSERRANAVKDYLIRKGVEAGRISTYAYGESKPVATNDTPEGRAQNRRAETRTRGE